MKILSLDVGEKRIGVAKVDTNTRIAVPVGYINVDGSEWRQIAHLATLNNTKYFVLGLPRSNEGNETAQSLYVRNFAKNLVEKLPGAKVRFQDESLTSVVAEERLKKRKKNYEKGEIDAEAAAIILQDFVEGGAPDFLDNSATEVAVSNTNLVRKEAEKVTFKAKKVKHKTKKVKKALIIPPVLLIIALLGVGGFLGIKEWRARERAAEYARLEAEMQPDTFTFTILPGETIFDIKKKLIEVGYSETDVTAALNTDYDYDFLADRPSGATLEGYLYGETHEFYNGTPLTEVIDTYLKGMKKVIEDNNLETRYAAQGLSLFEGITLASVVQKEAAPADQPLVAQVFLNRLALGWKMGSDVTVSYALDVLNPDRGSGGDNSAALTVDSCYNTRLYTGLPCGPISNPSLSALLAVAEPQDTAYLYFLTGDDGLMYYGYTEAEHLQNIRLHCQDLCNVSLWQDKRIY